MLCEGFWDMGCGARRSSGFDEGVVVGLWSGL